MSPGCKHLRATASAHQPRPISFSRACSRSSCPRRTARSFGPHGDSFPRRGVPDSHRLVEAAGDQAMAIRTEGHAEDPAFMAGEPERFLATLHIPEPHGPVLAGGGQPPTVRAESDS